jgi:hypothetical protein
VRHRPPPGVIASAPRGIVAMENADIPLGSDGFCWIAAQCRLCAINCSGTRCGVLLGSLSVDPLRF